MKHVLIVDDDYDICEALQLILSPKYRISIAYNGEQALERILREPVDAVVLDLMMPVMDGETLVRELRARGCDVPVVFASAATHLPARARSAGAAAWLQKPYGAAELEQALEGLFGPEGGGSSRGDEVGEGGASDSDSDSDSEAGSGFSGASGWCGTLAPAL